jgi:ATP-dependent RNA helicase DeaD
MSNFLELGLRNDLVKGLNELGINSPTEIQIKSIPILLKSQTDFIGLAQTGTGKTAAFGLPILQQINVAKPEVQALILAPTRELVQQIKKQLFKFTKYVEDRIFLEAVYGGEKIEKQIKALKRPTHIIIATPGRLIDLIERQEVSLNSINTLVLDEADEMLSMGFKQDLNRILKYTKGLKNKWLYSATFPEEIQKLVKTYMSKEAIKVTLNDNRLKDVQISHQYIKTSIKEKIRLLIQILGKRSNERGIVFCRTKAGTRNLTKILKEKGFSVGALEGDMQQLERDKVMRAFRKENVQILISTDVSSRGIDVNDLAFVIHFQLPEQIEYYIHRAGRTARAGKKGVSIAFAIPDEIQQIKHLEQLLNIKINEITI